MSVPVAISMQTNLSIQNPPPPPTPPTQYLIEFGLLSCSQRYTTRTVVTSAGGRGTSTSKYRSNTHPHNLIASELLSFSLHLSLTTNSKFTLRRINIHLLYLYRTRHPFGDTRIYFHYSNSPEKWYISSITNISNCYSLI